MTNLGDMTPGAEREHDEWEEALNIHQQRPVGGPMHKYMEEIGRGRAGERGAGV